MKKWIYLASAVILMTIYIKTGWFFDGETASAAALQVKTGAEYREGRAIVGLIEVIRMILLFFIGLFAFLFGKQIILKSYNK